MAVFDEFPDAYETELVDGRLQRAVSYWLSTVDAIPFDDYTGLIENRDDEQRRSDALLWFEDHGIGADETHVFDDGAAHASAPLAVFSLLAGEGLGNGFETVNIDDFGTGVFNRETGQVSLLHPPGLTYAVGIVALDGTPTKEMWELVLGESNHRPLGQRLTSRQVLQSGERGEYLRDALNLHLVRTTDAVKSYSPRESEIERRVSLQEDAALLEGISEHHGEQPSLITTNRAEGLYDDEAVLDLVDETKHYGNVLGSNEFADKRLGSVIGSRNYGPLFVKKWCAYAGETVEPTFPSPDNEFTPTDYGQFGNKIRAHMREHETLQAAMRFGRDGNGAVVYVHTDTLPEWVPLSGQGRVVTTWSDGMKAVLRALEDLETATTADVVAHPAVELSRQQVFDHLETLREREVLSREQDDVDGRRVRWTDDGLHRVNDHGDVDLEPIDLADLTADEVRQLARSSIYTWQFTNSASDGDDHANRPLSKPSTPTQTIVNSSDPPLNDAE